MSRSPRPWPALAAALVPTFLVLGVPYWSVPVGELSLPSSLPGAGLVLVALAALGLCASGRVPFLLACPLAAAAVPAVVFARVVVDGMREPTSHNLWPIELVIAGFLGLACAVPGAALGALGARFLGGPARA